MAGNAYVGVNGVARSVTAAYIGVDGLARRIRKAYVGIGGVARPCFGSEKVTYYGVIDALPKLLQMPIAASNGKHVVVVGIDEGTSYSGYFNAAYAYDTSLSVSMIGRIDDEHFDWNCATNVGDYTLFDRSLGHASAGHQTLFAFDASLTMSTLEGFLEYAHGKAATSVNGYALFAGGLKAYGSSDVIEVLDASLTKISSLTMSSGRGYMAATTVGEYAVFAGGANRYEDVFDAVDCVDAALTVRSLDSLSVARTDLSSASTKKHAIFAGGQTSHAYVGGGYGDSAAVDTYDKYLTHSPADRLSIGRTPAGVTLGTVAIFGGGRATTTTDKVTACVETYDSSLTHEAIESLSKSRQYIAGAAISKYALFIGGADSDTEWLNITDAYKL